MTPTNSSHFSRNALSVGDYLKWIEKLPGETTHYEVIASKPPVFGDWPALAAPLTAAVRKRGVVKLYSHQAHAITKAMERKNVVVVTPTASGKTLCYNLPTLDAIIRDHASRALYIFPTKALAQDQLAELTEFIDAAEINVSTFTYDGDTPVDARAKIRVSGHIVVTNPDMLHSGILPHHTKWVKLFENLKYVVLDELHTYRGIFGSHVANIIRRLKRLCAFYGSNPTFICCSATIANPKELAETLTGMEMELVSENGAPAGEKHVLFYNPPIVNRQLGIRRSALLEVAHIAGEAIANDISTIVFTRSRVNVELLLTYLRKDMENRGVSSDLVAGYRGGYLPNERRAIERRLRAGDIKGVVTTNALELGIDIGSLDLAVLHGYPGSVASAWQQIGRVGRRRTPDGFPLSAAVMVATSLPLDQFLTMRPSYFYGASPERARINPDNPYIQIGHVKCSAFELPFDENARFDNVDVSEALDYLERYEVLHLQEGRYYWQADSYPAESLSLRSATSENYVILDMTDANKPIVIGQMDRRSAPTLIHPQAIYFHNGDPYQVDELDHVGMRCLVKRVNVDYYTDADAAARITIIDTTAQTARSGWGEVLVATRPTVYKKIKLLSHENVGYGHIHLPEEQMHSTGCWFVLSEDERWGAWDEEMRGNALTALSNLLRAVAPLYLMCDRSDIIVQARVKDPHLERPAVFVVDNIPGGVGLAETVYELGAEMLAACGEAIESCQCEAGCPACIGVPIQNVNLKEVTGELLKKLAEEQRRQD